MQEILTKKEAAKYLRISVPTLDRLRAAGKITAWTECGVKYRLSDLREFVGLSADYENVEELRLENERLRLQIETLRKKIDEIQRIFALTV